MSESIELPFNKKLNLLREHCFDDGEWESLDTEKWCLHCRKKFNGHSVRVWKGTDGQLWLECGTPECDGSPIDWAPYPWWDDQHPETQAWQKRSAKPKRRRKPGGADDVPF